MALRFLELPPELFERIFGLLSARDMLALAASCKMLHDAYNASPEAQFQLELQVSGMAAGPLGGASVRDRLEQLRRKQRIWQYIEAGEAVPTKFWRTGSIWDLLNGFIAQGNMSGRGQPKFHFTRLPAPGREEIQAWEFENINVPDGVRDFSFDPAMDLMLLIQARSWPLTVHIRHMSTNEPHRDAAQPIFEWTRPNHAAAHPTATSESFYIQIMGDLFGILRLPSHRVAGTLFDQNELVVGNWRTGKTIATLMLPELVMQTFSFISPTHFIVGAGDPVHMLSRFGLSRAPRLQVYRFDPNPLTSNTDIPPAPTPTCELHLPVLAASYYAVSHWITRSDPSPGSNIATAYSRPFALGADDRILTLTLPIRSIEGHTLTLPEVVIVFVRMSSLLKISAIAEAGKRQQLAAATPDSAAEPPLWSVFWEGWCSDARLLRIPRSAWQPTWVCYVYGLRFVMAVADGEDDEEEDEEDTKQKRIVLFDFNQLTVRRAANRQRLERAGPPQASYTDNYTAPSSSTSEPSTLLEPLMEVDDKWPTLTVDDDDMDSDWIDDDDSDEEALFWSSKAKAAQQTKTDVKVHLEPSTHQSDCFANPVTSGLPYMVTTSGETYPMEAAMLDEDNIILVNDGSKQRRRDLTFLPMF